MEDGLVAMEECFDMMQRVTQAMTDEPEKFPNITSSEIQTRGEDVHDQRRKVDRCRAELSDLKRRRDKATVSVSSGGSAKPGGASGGLADAVAAEHRETDGYIQREQEFMETHRRDQDHILGMIGNQVESAIDKNKRISAELETQEKRLSQIDKDMSLVQNKMESAAKRVGKMLDEASDNKKIITIVVLIIILFVLVVFVFTG